MTSNQRIRLFDSSTYALEVVEGLDLSSKTYAITGTTSGIGAETTRALVLSGAHVVMLNRNFKASEEQKKKYLNVKPDARIDSIECDLSSLKSVKKAAEEFLSREWKLDGLILNAGVLGPESPLTSDGFEAHFGINHLAHFLLLRELLPVLRSSAQSRVVILSSMLSRYTFITPNLSIQEKLNVLCPKTSSQWYYTQYAQSKMCNMLTAFKLHRDEPNISTHSVHPGSAVRTELHRSISNWSIINFLSIPFTKNASQGAATSVYCVAHPEVEGVSGRYWSSCWDDEKRLDEKVARDEELQDALWKYSEELIDNCLKKS